MMQPMACPRIGWASIPWEFEHLKKFQEDNFPSWGKPLNGA